MTIKDKLSGTSGSVGGSMLVARVSPPLPDTGLPRQISFQRRAGNRVFEIATRPGGLLVRRLAADLADMGYEVAWVRPLPFEVETSSLGALLLMAFASARRSSSSGREPLVVVESPTATQVETLVGQLLGPGAHGAFAPSMVMVMDNRGGISAPVSNSIHLQVPSLSPRLARRLVPEQDARVIPLRQLSRAADGLAGLVDGALRSLPLLGGAELAGIVTKARDPAALTRALASRILRDASAEQLAAVEMSGRLGYAHARLRALEPAVARSPADPWWIPLTADWLQVNPAWQEALVAQPMRAPGLERSVCLSRLVADLVDEGAVPEAIELCIDAGWHGLAADLLAGEAERLECSGRHATLIGWLARLSAQETGSHSGLAKFALEWHRTTWQADQAKAGQRVPMAPVTRPSTQQRRFFRRLSLNPANPARPAKRPPARRPPATELGDSVVVLTERYKDELFPPAARTGLAGQDSGPPGNTGLAAAPGPRRPGQATLPLTTPASPISKTPGTRPWLGATDAADGVPVEARLLGSFELCVDGQPVLEWRGNRGRLLLAFLLLHRARPVHRDALGGVFWPEATPDVARNRLHVALYGLRRDLRAISPHPIVIHERGGFTFHSGADLWIDKEAFTTAVRAGRRQEVSRPDLALGCYETALELYRGDLLEDAPYEEWALLDREQLKVQYLEMLDRIAKIRFEIGRYADCIEVCQRLASGYPCREDIHRLLMRCYARLNKPHLAVHQYHQCERQLRDETGLKPAGETQNLYEQIRRRQPV
jgi:DNA-binding SARP family transcriptional activator